jgi:transposase-like protein
VHVSPPHVVSSRAAEIGYIDTLLDLARGSRGTRETVRAERFALRDADAGHASARRSHPDMGAALPDAITRLWENAWTEFIPFLDYDVEIRKVICYTNAIESLNVPLPARGQSQR